MERTLRRLAVLAASTTLLAAPAVAFADDTVVILGFQSMEGDDDFALSLSGAVRHAASQIAGWNVSDREVSLDQMSLAHGCDAPNASCMESIAATLEVDRVIFGTVRRSSSGADFDFDVNVQIYDARSNRIAETIEDRVPRIRSDIDHLRGRVRRYAEQLAGQVMSGTLVVVSNVEGAEVFVDGDSLGFISGSELRSQLPAGDRQIEIRADGYETFHQTVEVTASTDNTLEAVLIEGEGDTIPEETVDEGGGLPQGTLGWAAIGLGGAGLVMAVVSWLALDGIGDLNAGDLDLVSNNATVTSYRSTIGEDVDDFCVEADAGRTGAGFEGNLEDVQSACSSASLFSALYYTGLIIGVVGTGLGLVLILTEDEEQDPADRGERIALRPMLDQHRAGLSASLQF